MVMLFFTLEVPCLGSLSMRSYSFMSTLEKSTFSPVSTRWASTTRTSGTHNLYTHSPQKNSNPDRPWHPVCNVKSNIEFQQNSKTFPSKSPIRVHGASTSNTQSTNLRSFHTASRKHDQRHLVGCLLPEKPSPCQSSSTVSLVRVAFVGVASGCVLCTVLGRAVHGGQHFVRASSVFERDSMPTKYHCGQLA